MNLQQILQKNILTMKLKNHKIFTLNIVSEKTQSIPAWIKNTAGWWATNQDTR